MFNDKKTIASFLVIVFLFILDRLLKTLALNGLFNNYQIYKDWLKFNFMPNPYIAFSLPINGIFLIVFINIAILGLLLLTIKCWQKNQKINSIFLLASILGAASNLYDRLRFNYVIDYLDLKYFTVFNIADALILIGIVFFLFNQKTKHKTNLIK